MSEDLDVRPLFPHNVTARILNKLTSTQVPPVAFLTWDELEAYLVDCTILMKVVETTTMNARNMPVPEYTVATVISKDADDIYGIIQMTSTANTIEDEVDMWMICRCSATDIIPLVNHMRQNFSLVTKSDATTFLQWISEFSQLTF